MHFSNRTQAATVAAALSIVLLAACDHGGEQPQTLPPSTSAAPAPVVAAQSVKASGALTLQEVTWLDAVDALRRRIDGMAATLPEGSEATSRQLTTVADTLRGCTRELRRIGDPGDRLRTVHTLVTQACRQYDKVAACYDTLAAAPTITRPTQRQLRALNQAGDCITAGSVNAAKIMVDVEAKILEIRAAD